MFRLRSIGIVLLVVVDLHYYCSTATPLATILDFLELHFTYCTAPLCSATDNLTFDGLPCCQSCSCNKDCESDGTCCPDFLRYKNIDDVISVEAASLIINSQQYNDTAFSEIGKDFLLFKYNVMYDCVDYRLRYGDINFDIPKIKKAYEMIAVCPNSYETNTSIQYLCEVSVHEYRKNMANLDGSNLEELVSIFTPVTSLKTNITYRNIFCLGCSGENISDNDYIFWTAFFTCWSGLLTIPSENPYEVFDFVFKYDGEMNDCNIIMKPPKVIEPLTPKKCTRSDFNTCPSGTDTILDLFCRSFNLPVKQDSISSEYKIYQNIACYLCNQITDKYFNETCRYTRGSFFEHIEAEYIFEICLNLIPPTRQLSAYFPLNTSNIETINKNAANSSYRNGSSTTEQEVVTISKLEDIKKLTSSYCKNNTDSKKCGDIMCPMYFYQSHGVCIPTFTSFGGIYYSICLEIETKQSQQLKFVLPVMTDNLDRVARSFFNNYSFELWYPAEEEKDKKTIVAVINIISTDPDLLSTFNRIDIFLRNMADLTFQTEQGFVDIAFRLTTKDEYRFIDENNIRWGFSGILLNAYRRGTKLPKPLSEVKILQTMGCYRIVIESPGYRPDLPPSKYIAISSEYKNSKWFVKYIACLADVLPIDFGTTDTYIFKGFSGKMMNPIGSTQEPNMNPIGSTQEPNMNSIGSTQEPNMNSIGSTQEPNMNPIGSTQEPNMNSIGSTQEPNMNPIGSTQEPNDIIIKNNVSTTENGIIEPIEDSIPSYSVGLREESLIVVAVITLDLIMLTIVI